MTNQPPPPARRCDLKKPANCREESETPHQTTEPIEHHRSTATPNRPTLDHPDLPDLSAHRTTNQQPQPDRHVGLGKDAAGVALPGPLAEAHRDLQRSRVVGLVSEPEGIADVAHVEHVAEQRRHIDLAGGDEAQRLAE